MKMVRILGIVGLAPLYCLGSTTESGKQLLAVQEIVVHDVERTKLEAGEILVQLTGVTDTPVKKATALAIVDAPPAQVFAVLTDYASFAKFMPYCRKVDIQQKDKEHTLVRFELDFPWPIGDRHYVLRMTDRSVGTADKMVLVSSWEYEPDSGNINDTYGSWEVRPYTGDRSIVRYTVFTDPGGNVPGWAANMATETAVPNVIKGLRKRVKQVARFEETTSPGIPDEDGKARQN